MGHKGRDNSGSPMENDGFLEVVLVPSYLVLVGELFFLGEGFQRGDVGVREQRLLHPVAFERGVIGDVAHLGFLGDKG